MGVAPYVFYCLGCHNHVLIEADARQNECEGALPEHLPGLPIHVDDPAGAQGEGSGSRCRMGWTGPGAAGRAAPRNCETPTGGSRYRYPES